MPEMGADRSLKLARALLIQDLTPERLAEFAIHCKTNAGTLVGMLGFDVVNVDLTQGERMAIAIAVMGDAAALD